MAQFGIVSGKYDPDNRNKAHFTIGLVNDSISIKSKFTRLDLNTEADIDEEEEDDDDVVQRLYKIRIDLRRLHQVFSAISMIKPNAITCSISHQNGISLHFYHQMCSFKLTLPNIAE